MNVASKDPETDIVPVLQNDSTPAAVPLSVLAIGRDAAAFAADEATSADEATTAAAAMMRFFIDPSLK